MENEEFNSREGTRLDGNRGVLGGINEYMRSSYLSGDVIQLFKTRSEGKFGDPPPLRPPPEPQQKTRPNLFLEAAQPSLIVIAANG